MQNTIYDKGRIAMGRGVCGFDATSLIHCDINQNTTIPHGSEHFAGDEFGCACACNQHRADHRIRRLDNFPNIATVGIERR